MKFHAKLKEIVLKVLKGSKFCKVKVTLSAYVIVET